MTSFKILVMEKIIFDRTGLDRAIPIRARENRAGLVINYTNNDNDFGKNECAGNSYTRQK